MFDSIQQVSFKEAIMYYIYYVKIMTCIISLSVVLIFKSNLCP